MGRAALARAAKLYALTSCAIACASRVRDFKIVALQRLARRECDRVHDDVESVPALAQRFEGAIDLGIARDITFQDDIRACLGRQLGHAFAETFVLTGECELGTPPGASHAQSPRRLSDCLLHPELELACLREETSSIYSGAGSRPVGRSGFRSRVQAPSAHRAHARASAVGPSEAGSICAGSQRTRRIGARSARANRRV